MKKIIALLTAAVLILAFAGCAAGNNGSQSQAETKAAESSKAEEATNAVETIQGSDATAAKNDTGSSGKTLVVYFSATGTTKGVAEQIASVTGAETYEINSSFQRVMEQLSGYGFVQTHKSFLVNRSFIHFIEKTELTLDDGTKIPISRSYFKQVQDAFARYAMDFKSAT